MDHEIAFAKVNLALHVRRRRADGYHDIESLFAFAEHGDVLAAELSEGGEIALHIDGPFGEGLSAGEDNLVMQAARALQAASGACKGATIRLTKALPVASGIGGGSADAAAALRLLDRLWAAALPEQEMLAIAADLGSDVPACLVSRTLMGSGRGEMLDLRDIEGLSGLPMLLVNPGVPLSTAPVFGAWDQVDRGALAADGLDLIIAEGRNDLEAPAISIAPAIRSVIDLLAQAPGVLLARMSGSGATCFALFRDAGDCAAAAAEIRDCHPGWWFMETRLR